MKRAASGVAGATLATFADIKPNVGHPPTDIAVTTEKLPMTSRTILGTDYILEALAAEGLRHLVMLPAGLVDPFLPALARQKKLKPVIAAHEGGAVYMADGYARASGRFGAALVGSAAPAAATWRPRLPPPRPTARRCW